MAFVGIVLGVAMIPFILYWRMPRRALKLFHQQKAAAHAITPSRDAEAIVGHLRAAGVPERQRPGFPFTSRGYALDQGGL